jgi:hypothetical protein
MIDESREDRREESIEDRRAVEDAKVEAALSRGAYRKVTIAGLTGLTENAVRFSLLRLATAGKVVSRGKSWGLA